MSNEVHDRLKQIDEDTIDNLPDHKLKQLEGIQITQFVQKF